MNLKRVKVLVYVLLGQILFSTMGFCQETFVDSRDDNVYKTIKIGKKVWMAENLRYLPKVTLSGELGDYYDKEGRYFVYGYSGTSVEFAKQTEEYQTYGVLYNSLASKTACPAGWHLPKDSEWKQLEKALGMKGGDMNQIGNRGTSQGVALAGNVSLWTGKGKVQFMNQMFGKSGFMALPGGFVGIDGRFHDLGSKAFFWTATEYCDGFSYCRSIGVNSLGVYRNSNDNRGALSVRCIKN